MANRLANATSPYLLQHAGNPVDWHEWGEEALERARAEEKPILLSIGYAACHWCHVMERESFEDEATARLMNEHFVCVKVDREERPDLDAIYMDAVQAMTGHGGWPMTVFLTPDGRPFFAGTYFPPEDRHGMPGFPRVLTSIAEAWRERRDELLAQGSKVVQAISRSLPASREPLTEDTLRQAASQIGEAYDAQWGGFGPAPKFPQPMTLDFLLRRHLRGDGDALRMVNLTLDRMAAGGIHDQLGGGFHRYSTDAAWLVPHFEKMLYDNALLARTYLHAHQVTGNQRYREVCVGTLEYLLREMRHPGGGIYSSQDADSEGEEGRFFVWSRDELVAEAGEHAEAVAAYLGALPEGNWEGRNVLWTPLPLEKVAADAGLEPGELAQAVQEARARLFEVRERRVKPATDDKVVAAWNGLAIRAFAEAGRALGEPRYVDAASAAADFVLTRMVTGDGRLLRAWRDDRTSGPGYVDDHACMAAACLALYETTFDPHWMREALRLADELIRLFHDPDGDGFFQTGADAEELVLRPKELFDNAVPAGGSTAAEVLQRLALLTGEHRYEKAGVSALRAIHPLMARAPSMLGHALCALELYVSDAREVAVIGDAEAPETRALLQTVWDGFRPDVVLAAGAPGDASEVPLLEGKGLIDGRPAAYVCRGFVCEEPVTGPAALATQLGEVRPGGPASRPGR